MSETKHSPFPYYIDPHVPTAVFDANGWKFAATTPGQMFPEIDPETAADNAALIAAIPAMVSAMQEISQFCSGEDTTLGALKRLVEIRSKADAVLASIGKKP